MNALITKQSSTEYGQYFTINVEGAEIFVSVYTDGRVNVCAIRTAIALALTCAPDFAKLQA
jgi:UDP-N-acetylmuramyl pentapeptide synthase